MDLLFPGRKPKEVLEEGGDDDLDTGDKKDDGDVKGMFDCSAFSRLQIFAYNFGISQLFLWPFVVTKISLSVAS